MVCQPLKISQTTDPVEDDDDAQTQVTSPTRHLLCRRTPCRHICTGVVHGFVPGHVCSLHQKRCRAIAGTQARGTPCSCWPLGRTSSTCPASRRQRGMSQGKSDGRPCMYHTIVFAKSPSGPRRCNASVSGRNEQERPSRFCNKPRGTESHLGAFVKAISSADALTRQHDAVCGLMYRPYCICLCFCRAGI